MNIFGKEYKRPKWIPLWLNIPFVVFLFFILSLFFFGENNYMKISKYKKQIHELKAEIKNNEDSTLVYEAKVKELHTDKSTLERMAREKYGMKRANEDVYATDIP